MKLSNGKNKKSIAFYSYHLNEAKYKTIEQFAIQAREYKNQISKIYFDNYFHKQHISCFDFIKAMNVYRDKTFSSSIFIQICKQIYEKYNKKKPPKTMVKFKQLSFIGINQCKVKMFEESNNKYTNGIINFNIAKVGMIEIPFRYSKQYHGNLEEIKYSLTGRYKEQYRKQYTCTLLGNNKVKITIAIDCDEQPIQHTMNHIEGVDVNCKHNLLQCSDGYSVDYDRKLVNKIQKQCKKLDTIQSTKQKRGLDTSLTYAQLQVNLKNRRRSISMVEQLLVKLFKHCQKHKIDHLVFEDLDKFTGKSKTKNTEFDLNYHRLMSILHLVDIKNMAIRIGKKYGITVSLTNSEYTSQECSHCHHISKNNRTSQEKFKCEKCGMEMNADLNASINIKERINSNVLRESFHDEADTNIFVPTITNHKDFTHSYMYWNHIMYY